MTKNEGIDKVVKQLAIRAHVVVDEGHSELDILKSAFNDFKSMGSLSGIMSVMSSGKLTQQQVDIAQRIAVKVLAVLGIQESNKKQEKKNKQRQRAAFWGILLWANTFVLAHFLLSRVCEFFQQFFRFSYVHFVVEIWR